MLVLTRKVGEKITIDGDICISIVQVKGKQVRVGVSAPKQKSIKRTELLMPPPKALKELVLSKPSM